MAKRQDMALSSLTLRGLLNGFLKAFVSRWLSKQIAQNILTAAFVRKPPGSLTDMAR